MKQAQDDDIRLKGQKCEQLNVLPLQSSGSNQSKRILAIETLRP
jgi:hypothetical protein